MTLEQLRALDAVAVLGQVHVADVPSPLRGELIALGALEPIDGASNWYRLTSLGRGAVDEQRARAGGR